VSLSMGLSPPPLRVMALLIPPDLRIEILFVINPIYNAYSTKALRADALPHRRFVSIDLKDQLPEVFAACLLDGKHRIAEALLAHAPVQEVSYFAELIHRICVNRGVVHSGQNWQLIRYDKLLEFYNSLSPAMEYLNLLGPDGFQTSAAGNTIILRPS